MVVFDGGKNADFVESVLDLFLGKIGKFDLFQGINLVVLETLDFVDCGVRALAYVSKKIPSFEVIEKSLSDINIIWPDNFNHSCLEI